MLSIINYTWSMIINTYFIKEWIILYFWYFPNIDELLAVIGKRKYKKILHLLSYIQRNFQVYRKVNEKWEKLISKQRYHIDNWLHLVSLFKIYSSSWKFSIYSTWYHHGTCFQLILLWKITILQCMSVYRVLYTCRIYALPRNCRILNVVSWNSSNIILREKFPKVKFNIIANIQYAKYIFFAV